VDTAALDAETEERALALQRAEAAEAKLRGLESEIQKAATEADGHRIRAEQHATNAQVEMSRAEAMHQEREDLNFQLQQIQQMIAQSEAHEAELQQQSRLHLQALSAKQEQELADAHAQSQSYKQVLVELEGALGSKELQYEQMMAEMESSKNQRIDELVMEAQNKDQEVAALASEVQVLKETMASIEQLEDERAQLMAISTEERSIIAERETLMKEMQQLQQVTATNEQEYSQLQDQLRGSQMELAKAQVQIAELEQQLTKAEAEAAAATAVAAQPSSPPKRSPYSMEALATKPVIVESPSPSFVQKVTVADTIASLTSSQGSGSYTTSMKVPPTVATTIAEPKIKVPTLTAAVPGGSFSLPVAKLNGSLSLPGPHQINAPPQPIRFSYGSTRTQYNALQARASPIRGQTYTRTSGANAYATNVSVATTSASGAYGSPGVQPVQRAAVQAPVPYGPVRQIMSDNASTVAYASPPGGPPGGRLRVASSPISTNKSRTLF